jgi:hypothetical protein
MLNISSGRSELWSVLKGIRYNNSTKLINIVDLYSLQPYTYPRADGAKRRARVLIPPGYLHQGKRKH